MSLKISQLKEHSEVMWLNPINEQLAKGLKKGQGPVTACLGEFQLYGHIIGHLYIHYWYTVFDAFIVLLCVDKKLKQKESKVI